MEVASQRMNGPKLASYLCQPVPPTIKVVLRSGVVIAGEGTMMDGNMEVWLADRAANTMTMVDVEEIAAVEMPLNPTVEDHAPTPPNDGP